MINLLTYRKQLLSAFILTLVTTFGGPVIAGSDVYLTLVDASGKNIVELTEDQLLAMDQAIVLTENEFVDGMGEFSGPLARDVIALMGDDLETVILTAVNDYAVPVPVADFIEYDVIFALSRNGENFSIRDKGPIWVIYPMSDHEELQDRVYNDRLIWQLVKVNAL